MKIFSRTCWAVALLLAADVVHAELPTLNEKDWLGYFVGVDGRKAVYGITAQGAGSLRPIGSKGPVGGSLSIPIRVTVEEMHPDGKASLREIDPTSLQSDQKATLKPVDVTYKGKVKGDATFEAFVTENRGVVSLGGRLLDPGKAKDPVKLSIKAKIPDLYSHYQDNGDKEAAKKLEDKTKDDRMHVTYADGKKKKISTTEKVNAAGPDVTGAGISELEFEFSTYADMRFHFVASPGTSMVISNEGEALHRGFTIIWTADPAKDPEGKARLSFDVK